MTGSKRFSSLALAVLTVAALLRLVALDADPPLDYGAAHLTDEGYYLKNGKERVVRGAWVPDDDNHNHVYLAPLTVAALAGGLAGGGLSLESGRAVSATVSLLALLLVIAPLRRLLGDHATLAALTLLAVDPALVLLGRVALGEGFVLAPSLLFVVALASALERGQRWWPLVLWFTVALLTKASAVSLVAVAAIAVGLEVAAHGSLRDRRAWLTTGAALAAVVAAWRVMWVRGLERAQFMFDYEFDIHVRQEAWNPLANLWRSLDTKHAIVGFTTNPVLAGMATVVVVVVLAQVARRQRPCALELCATAWLMGTALFFSAMPYQPPRYFLALCAPAALLVARSIATPAEWWRRAAAIPALTVVYPLLFALPAALAIHDAGVDSVPRAVLLAAGAGMASAYAVRTDRRWLLVALLVATPLVTHIRWINQRTYTIRDASQRITAYLTGDGAIVGYFADTFALGAPARAYVVHGPWNPGRLDDRGVAWLLVRDEELQWLVDRDPTLRPRLVLVDAFAPQNGVRGVLTLYRVAHSE